MGKPRAREGLMGDRVDVLMPEGRSAVILCGNNGGGWVPFSFILPGQVYVKNLERAGWQEIAAFPVDAKDYVNVWPLEVSDD
jgi:hypothetical protein